MIPAGDRPKTTNQLTNITTPPTHDRVNLWVSLHAMRLAPSSFTTQSIQKLHMSDFCHSGVPNYKLKAVVKIIQNKSRNFACLLNPVSKQTAAVSCSLYVSRAPPTPSQSSVYSNHTEEQDMNLQDAEGSLGQQQRSCGIPGFPLGSGG